MAVTRRRCERNPIVTPALEHALKSLQVSNAGAAIRDGRVHVLYRAEGEGTRPGAYQIRPISRMGLAGVATAGQAEDYSLRTGCFSISGKDGVIGSMPALRREDV